MKGKRSWIVVAVLTVLLGLTAAVAEAGEPVPCPSIGAPQDGGYIYDPDNVCDDSGNPRRPDDSTSRRDSNAQVSIPVESAATPDLPCWAGRDHDGDGVIDLDDVLITNLAFLDNKVERDKVTCVILRYFEVGQ